MAAALLVVACSPSPSPSPSPPPVAFLPIEVSGVGAIAPGRTSAGGLVLRLTEAGVDTIARGPGTMVVTLSDQTGRGGTVGIVGTPSIDAPGSLGITAILTATNVLEISIVDSDPLNIEPVTIAGLRLSASQDAAPGAIRETITACTGSLAGCAPSRELPSPGTVGGG